MSVLIKICGLSTFDSVDVALDAGADMIGFVFFTPSPRHVAFETARALGERVKGRALKVAVSVDGPDSWLAAIMKALDPDLLQLHGTEKPARVAAIRTKFGRPVMKAVAVEQAEDLVDVPLYAEVADRLLFDARAPQSAARPGGLGRTFDWNLLENCDLRRPFMLSGGLDATNVAEALRVTRAPGVDVSSGVERAPGEKDLDKIRAFIRATRQAAGSVST